MTEIDISEDGHSFELPFRVDHLFDHFPRAWGFFLESSDGDSSDVPELVHLNKGLQLPFEYLRIEFLILLEEE